ncbi:MAG: hypothetical protein IJ867_03845 [Clostridia bacterium]|nr:hypothetical protein [Clostridia bacterium]
MISTQYSNAMAETLHYLKGIRKEDVDKIPSNFLNFLEEHASKGYQCNFDNTKPLSELEVLPETRGLIGTICLNYWCTTKEQKEAFQNKLRENERVYQEKQREIYNPDVFGKMSAEANSAIGSANISGTMALQPVKESIFTKIKNWFKSLLH